MQVLIAYATRKGSTAEIANYIAARLKTHKVASYIHDVAQPLTSLANYQSVILLTPIYKGLWLPQMTKFVRTHTAILNTLPIWAIFPCIRVLEPDGIKYAYDNYLPTELLNRINVQDVHFIAGKMLRREIDQHETITLNTRYDGSKLQHIDGDYRNWNDLNTWVNTIVFKLHNPVTQP